MAIINLYSLIQQISSQYKCCVILNGKIFKSKYANTKNIQINNIDKLSFSLNENFDLNLEYIKSKNIIFLSKKYSNLENDLPNITYEEIMYSVLNICKLYEKFFPTFKQEYNTNATLKFAKTITKFQINALNSN